MARLDRKSAPGRWVTGSDSNVPYETRMKAEEEDFRPYKEASDAATEQDPTGFICEFPVADGAAMYRVTKTKPLTVQHIPYGDAWQAHGALIRGLRLQDVQHQIKFRDLFKKSA